MRTLRGNRTGRAGWTALELTIGIAFLVIVIANVSVIMQDAFDSSQQESATTHVEDQARRVLDRIANTIMGAERETLTPLLESPMLHASGLQYRISLGVEDGEVVWSDPEQILQDRGTMVAWEQNPGEAEERRTVWSRIVQPLLEGEIPNGVDDNGNGLIDEQGLTFVVDGDQVTIRLTLGRDGNDDAQPVRTVETRITCRN